jgi:hypothetical protein
MTFRRKTLVLEDPGKFWFAPEKVGDEQNVGGTMEESLRTKER